VLVASWLDRQPGDALAGVWFRVAGKDRESETFLAQLERRAQEAGLSLDERNLGAPEGRRVVLALDDFDWVVDPAVLRDLLGLVESNRRLHLIVCTRRRHPFEAMAAGSVETRTLNAVDFALTVPEIGELAALVGRPVSDQEATLLRRPFDGWMVPTRLVLEASVGGELQMTAADDYLRTTVLQGLSDRVVPERLIRVSLANRLTRAMFRELSEIPDPDAVFREFDTSGLTHRHDHNGEVVLTLPPAVRNTMRDLYAERHPEEVAPFHRRLARWYMDHYEPGFEVEAVKHALWGRDWEFAEQVWFDYSCALMIQPAGTWDDILDDIPRELVDRHPSLALYRKAMDIASMDSDVDGRMATLRNYFEASERAIVDMPAPSLLELVLVAAGHVVGSRMAGRVDQADEFAEQQAGRIQAAIDSGAGTPDAIRWFYLQWGLTRTLLGDDRGALRCYRRSWEHRTTSPADWVSSNVAANVAMTYAMAGDTAQAQRWLDRHHGFDTSRLWADYMLGIGAHVAEGLLALDRLDEDDVQPHLKHLGDGSLPLELWAWVVFLNAQSGLHFGEPLSALIALDQAVVAQNDGLAHMGAVAPLIARARADLLIAAGERQEARAVLTGKVISHPLLSVPATRIHLLAGDAPVARGAAVRALAEPGLNVRDRMELLLMEASAAIGMGEPDAAVPSFNAAVELFREHGTLRPFATVSPVVREALFDLTGPQLEPDDLARLALHPSDYPEQLTPIRLTAQERVVLEGLARNASRQDIAKEMFVSVNTVKTHLNAIYRKLGTSSRDETLMRAHQLGLL
jgi:LuxR family maltose regulon positive regulatory protein